MVGGVEVSVDGGSNLATCHRPGSWSYSWTATGVGSGHHPQPGGRRQRKPRDAVRRRHGDGRRHCLPVHHLAGLGDTRHGQRQRRRQASTWGSSSGPTSPASSPASASTREPATPAPTSERCGAAAGPSSPPRRSPAKRLPAGSRSTSRRPVPVTANTVYVASYLAPNGRYAINCGHFASGGVTAAPLHACRTASAAAMASMPTARRLRSRPRPGSRRTTGSTSCSRPTIRRPRPSPAAVRRQEQRAVATTSRVTVTFSEAMDAATINGSTVQLRDASNAAVTASVGYDPATQVATLTPTVPLTASSSFTATVRGGSSDPRVKDRAGNALAATTDWTFTTGTADTTAPTITSRSPASGATECAHHEPAEGRLQRGDRSCDHPWIDDRTAQPVERRRERQRCLRRRLADSHADARLTAGDLDHLHGHRPWWCHRSARQGSGWQCTSVEQQLVVQHRCKRMSVHDLASIGDAGRTCRERCRRRHAGHEVPVRRQWPS